MNRAPKRGPEELTALALAAATVVLVIFFILTRYYRYLALALFSSFGLYQRAEDRVRKPALAFFALAAALVLSGMVAFRSPSVLLCFAASTCWAVGLHAAKYFSRHKGFIAELLQGGFQFALTFSIVTGALSAIAAGLWRFPPDGILDWGGRIERMRRLFETLERYFLPATFLIAGFYIMLVWKGVKSDLLTDVWKKLVAVRTGVARAALAATMVLSFSFTVVHANGPDPYDGPLTALDHSKAEALRQYADLVRRIELNLKGRVKLQAYTNVLQALPPSIQQATIQEAAVSAARQQIPPEYFGPLAARPDTSQIVSWVNSCTASGRFWSATRRIAAAHPCTDSQAEWRSALAKSAGAAFQKADAETAPPPGVTLRSLAAADAAAQKLDEDTAPPEGMAGLGAQIASQLLDLSVSLSSIPGLKSFTEQFPLVSELLDVALDAVKALTTAEVEARQIAWDSLRDSSVPLRDRIRNAAHAHDGKAPAPVADRAEALERQSGERASAVAQAEARFHPDLSRAVSEISVKSDAQREKIERINGNVQEGAGNIKKPVDLMTPEGLLYVETREFLYDQTLSDLAVDPAHATALKGILTDSEFEEYRKRGESNRLRPVVPGVGPDGDRTKYVAEPRP